MDNFGSTGTSENDSTFAYVPPHLMYDSFQENNLYASKEERERAKYHYEEKMEQEQQEQKSKK